MRSNSSSIFIIAFIFIMLANGFGFSTFIMAIILYSILRSVIGKEDRRGSNRDRDHRKRSSPSRRREPVNRPVRREFERSKPQEAKRAAKPKPKNNPFKKSGIEKYKDYDYDGAISDFEKALGIDATDLVVHFNIACAYSLTEDKEKAFHHLTKAIENGFNDFEKIQSHDALAYIRIQDEYDEFVKNGYRVKTDESVPTGANKASSELLEQLQKLSELREKGLLTEDEFLMQKKKLLN